MLLNRSMSPASYQKGSGVNLDLGSSAMGVIRRAKLRGRIGRPGKIAKIFIEAAPSGPMIWSMIKPVKEYLCT